MNFERLIVEKNKLINLIPYTDFLKKYDILPVLGHKTYTREYGDDTVMRLYVINESDLNVEKKDFLDYYESTYIEDIDDNIDFVNFNGEDSMTNITITDNLQDNAIAFAEWLSVNMINYLDKGKTVTFKELYNVYKRI